jgi:hypothetical protein
VNACPCFESMRQVSRNGFVVAIRSTADRPLSAPGVVWSCVGCSTRYSVVPVVASRLVAA